MATVEERVLVENGELRTVALEPLVKRHGRMAARMVR